METNETLETGYGPATPSGDNILNDFARGEADGFRALAAARGERVYDDADLALALGDGESPSPFANYALLQRPLGADEWLVAVERMHDFFASSPGGPFLLMSVWPTPDLRVHDFGLVGHPPFMYRPAGPIPEALPKGLRIVAVGDAAEAAAYEDVLVHAYPVPELQPFSPGCFLPAPALDAPGWRHWVGYLDDAPVATASAYDDGQFVHVEFISARPECRGRGVGKAMTIRATNHGSRPAVLIASDAGRPTYERLGYIPVSRHTLWAGHRRP